MKKSTRIFILLAGIEVLIVAGAAYMLMQVTSGAWRTFDQAEAVRRIMTVMGVAFGGIGAVLLTLAIMLRIKGQ
ncbi:hypothetical protein ABFT80_13460 [Mesorhizobium sp. SB112]|uniref:hypothetical protein n=1 Tax=Mesorhizobium sp. SB112 TaxID=3151853 RepID=UPI00326731B6